MALTDRPQVLPPVGSIEELDLTGGPGIHHMLHLRYRDLDGRMCAVRMSRSDAIDLANGLLRILVSTGWQLPTREGLGIE